MVIDCEGAFYDILIDTPEVLDSIKLFIVENDYFDESKQTCVENMLKSNQFNLVYERSHPWDHNIKKNYQVWKRKDI